MRIIRQCKYKKIRQAFYKLAGFFYFSQILKSSKLLKV